MHPTPAPLALRAFLAWERISGYGWYGVSALATALHAPLRPTSSIRRLLIVKTDHLGDFLLCLPAVRDFLQSLPTSPEKRVVGFVVGTPTRELAEHVPWIDEIYCFDSRTYARRERTSPAKTLEEIFAREWDLIVDLTNDRASALAALSRPSLHRRDVGTYRLRSKLQRLVSKRRADTRQLHISFVNYSALGLPVPSPIVPEPLALRPEEKEKAGTAIARGWPGDRPIAALHAGATWEFRRWAPGRFAELAKRLEGAGYSVFLVGGPNDVEVSREVATSAGLAETRVLAGRLELVATAAVLERAAVVVANDGGLVHLAAAFSTPVVAIFGPTDPALFGPIGASSTFIYKKRDCSPCAQRHCIWGRARCLEPVETEAVFQEAMLRARPQP